MKSKLQYLIDYGFPRRIGSTTAMLQGFKNTPEAVCVVVNYNQAMDLGLGHKQFVTLDSLPHSIMGLKRPLLIDHYALDQLVRENNSFYETRIEKLEKELMEKTP